MPAADNQLPVFDRAGQGPLSNPDNEPGGVVGGRTRSKPAEVLSDEALQPESARPDLPDETSDGLDDVGEEVRRQAEDLPLDIPGRP